MEDQENNSLNERVELLERELAEIKTLLQRFAPSFITPQPQQTPPQSEFALKPRPVPITPAPASKSFELPEYMRKSEFWLSRIGIGLLLFGLAFLFKYSIDQGWITPPVRHFFGIGVGVLLFVFGWRLYSQRKHLSRLLLGGSVAAFYITDYSAFQLFELIPHPTAFALMVAITCLAFFISLRQDDTVFSIVGTVGGLATPFLLYTGSGSVPGLVGYTCVVLAGTAAIGFFKQWRTLLWVSGIGGWIVLMTGIEATSVLTGEERTSAQWSLQAGILFWWFCHAAVPAGRRVLSATHPKRWSAAVSLKSTVASSQALNALEQHLHLLAVMAPVTALFTSTGIWPDTPDHVFGWAAMVAAGVYFGASYLLRRLEPLKSLAYAHAIGGTILFTISLAMLLDGNALLLAFAAEAAALHLLAKRLSNRSISSGGHILAMVVGLWLIIRLLTLHGESPVLFNNTALTDLAVILGCAAVGLWVLTNAARMIYGLAAHLTFLAWLARELSTLDNGQGYVTIAWGVYGAILLIASLRLNSTRLRQIALGTLLLVVGKLFIVDLSELETIWRVLLFMGFGAVFLLLSYYFPKLWKGEVEK
jgi:uncharacterized membrane protein